MTGPDALQRYKVLVDRAAKGESSDRLARAQLALAFRDGAADLLASPELERAVAVLGETHEELTKAATQQPLQLTQASPTGALATPVQAAWVAHAQSVTALKSALNDKARRDLEAADARLREVLAQTSPLRTFLGGDAARWMALAIIVIIGVAGQSLLFGAELPELAHPESLDASVRVAALVIRALLGALYLAGGLALAMVVAPNADTSRRPVAVVAVAVAVVLVVALFVLGAREAGLLHFVTIVRDVS